MSHTHPKTENAERDIDLHSSLARELRKFVGQRKSGFLFVSERGTPICQSNFLKRHLHPLLNELGIDKAGFHAFRRFRTTWLRKNRIPEDLIRFWNGWANKSMTDLYSRLSEDVEFRKEWTEKFGLGFDLPVSFKSIERIERKMSKKKGPASVMQALVAA